MLRLMRGGVAIVTNENLARICRDLEVETLVLHDVLRPANSSAISSDSIVCPVSYSNDEPIEAILKAAASLPDTRWVLTGRAPREVKDAASSNVEFTGFLDDAAYDELLNNAGLVVALTNRRDTMQRAAYEALVRTVPIVTSDFQVLREFFEDSAVYVDPGAANLTSRISEAIASRETIRERSGLVLAKRMAEQQDALIRLNILVNRQTYITEEIH
jgi:glycosyltransferase involved in cell wall biosynthesis